MFSSIIVLILRQN